MKNRVVDAVAPVPVAAAGGIVDAVRGIDDALPARAIVRRLVEGAERALVRSG
jgi:NAD(P)H-dependent flavin oxidoreductase YrpB (nitropropane dioxygenase family)